MRLSRRQGLQLMLGAAQTVFLGAAGCAFARYAKIVTGRSGGAPLAYWRCSDAGTLVDEQAGGRDGAFTGTPSLVNGLLADSDQALRFPGEAYGEVADDAGLHLATFSVSGWLEVDSAPTAKIAVWSKDLGGPNDGDFALTIDENLTLGAQFQDASAQHAITTSIGLNTAHHWTVIAGGFGFDFFVDGRHIGRSTAFTNGWSDNTNPIQFAKAPWTTEEFVGVLDEVALYDYALTDADVVALSQVTSAPEAVSDSAVVTESQTEVIDVTANAVFVGRKENLTVEVRDGASWGTTATTTHGTATVDANNDIEFAADGVIQDEADSFDYRITDVNGTSSAATVSLTVTEASGASDFWVATDGDDTNPGTEAEPFRTILKGINTASAGQTVTVKPGIYPGFDWPKSGTFGSPITLKAQFPATTAVPADRTQLTGDATNGAFIWVDGFDHVIIDGFYADTNGGGFRIWNGTGGEIRNCRVHYPSDGGSIPHAIQLVRYSDMRIHHNAVIDEGPIQNNPVMDYAVQVFYEQSTNVEIDHNYIFGRGHQLISMKTRVPGAHIHHNTIDGCHFTGIYLGQEDDDVGDNNQDMTSTDLICEFNHIRDGQDSQGRYYRASRPIQIRNAKNCIVRYNLIENSNNDAIRVVEPGDTTDGGSELIGARHEDAQIYGNVILNCNDAFSINGRGLSTDVVEIYNNTIFGCAAVMECFAWTDSVGNSWRETTAPPDIQFKNNNVVDSATATGDLSTTTWQTNNWHNSGATRDASDLSEDPLFVATPATHVPGPPAYVFDPDFTKAEQTKLQAASGLIDAGTDVGLVFSGSTPDIGHNEFTY